MIDLAPRPRLYDASVIVESGDWVLLGTQFFQAAEVRRAENQVTVEVASTDAETDAAIQELAPRGPGTAQPISFAHRNNAQRVRVLAVESRTVQGTCIWTIKLDFEPRSRRGSMDEVTIRMHDGTQYTGDDAARTRAARILFEPSPTVSRSGFSTDHMREMQIRGHGPVVVERCFVQDTYALRYSSDPATCARQARLVAIWALKATNTVEFVERLALGPIDAGRLHVQFRGRRHRVYDNVEPATISLEGDCELLLPKEVEPPSLARQGSPGLNGLFGGATLASGILMEEAHRSLEKLLLAMFSADELRRLIRYLPNGEALAAGLPGVNASLVSLTTEAVAVLVREGMIDADFWDRLVNERPRSKADIDKVRERFASANVAPVQDGRSPGPVPPQIITVLLISASPDTRVRLRVDREFREIVERMRGSRFRDRFKFVPVLAARYRDLTTALQEHEPHVLHISSHGEPDSSLIFEGTSETPQRVSKRQLLKLLTALSDKLRLVVLNACHSFGIAKEIPSVIDLAIGMNDQVADQVAIDFAVAFYESLGFGKPVETAFNVALAGLAELDDELPQLFPAAADDPAKKRKRPLITA